MKLSSLPVLALVLAAPCVAVTAMAQPAPTISAAPAATAPEDAGLTGSVSDETPWQDLGIAIPVFPTDADTPTQTSAGSTAALGRQLAQIITADLRNNGLFKPTGPDSLPQPSIGQVVAPDFGVWSGQGAEMLVHGYVRANGDGNLTVGCYLYDVALRQQLVKGGWVVAPAEWRRRHTSARTSSIRGSRAKARSSIPRSPISPRPVPRTTG